MTIKRLDTMNKTGLTRKGMSYTDYCNTYQRPAFGARPLDVIDMENRNESRRDKTVLATEMRVAREGMEGWASGTSVLSWRQKISVYNAARRVATKSRKE